MPYLGVTFRLDPTPQQAAQFERWAGVCRLVWNLALEQRETAWRRCRKRVTMAEQCREIKDLRAAYPFIEKMPCNAAHTVIRDLETAYRNYFEGRARCPRWKSSKRNAPHIALREENVRVAPSGRHVWMSRAGMVRMRMSRELPGRILRATITRRAGHWYISFGCEVAETAIPVHSGPEIGLDVGIANTITLCSGEHIRMPTPGAPARRRLARLQRQASRRRRGSRGQKKALRSVARWYERYANVRQDFIAKTAHDLTARYSVVAVEDLAVDRMTRRAKGRGRSAKASLNREMLLRAFGMLRTRIEQKSAQTGTRVIAIDPRYTSQTCSCCGHVARENRESQAAFRCVECGYECHADVNAAINIRRAGLARIHAEGAGGHEGPASNSEPYTTSKEASYVQ